jgi:hypothetical protein
MIAALTKTGTRSEKALAKAVLVLGGELQKLNRRLQELEKSSDDTVPMKRR